MGQMNDTSENTVSSTNDISAETFETNDFDDLITSSKPESTKSKKKRNRNNVYSKKPGKKKKKEKSSLKVKWQMKIDTNNLNNVSSSDITDKKELSDTETMRLSNKSDTLENNVRSNKRVIKRKSWSNEYETAPFTPSPKKSKGIRPDCPPFCRTNCTLTHHPLLIAARKVIENDSSTTMQFLQKVESFYGGADGQMNPSDCINDQWKNTDYPLLHYLALMGKCACSFVLSQSGHEPTTTVTENGDNVLHTLVKDMYLFNCTHGHMDVLSKKFNLLLREFVDCLKFVNKRKETPLHINAKMISDTVLLLKDEARQKPPFRLYQFCKSMFDACLVQLSSFDDVKRLINLQDHAGFTVSHYIASDRASFEFLDRLKEMGADFDIKNSLNQNVNDIQKNAPSPPSNDLLELAVFSAKGHKVKSATHNKPKYSPQKKKQSARIEQEINTAQYPVIQSSNATNVDINISKPASLRIPLTLQKHTGKATSSTVDPPRTGPRIKVTPVRGAKENKTEKKEDINMGYSIEKKKKDDISDKSNHSQKSEISQSKCDDDLVLQTTTSTHLSSKSFDTNKDIILTNLNIDNSTTNVSNPPVSLKVFTSRFSNILPKSLNSSVDKKSDENSSNVHNLLIKSTKNSHLKNASQSVLTSPSVVTSPSVSNNLKVSASINNQSFQASHNVQVVAALPHMQLPNASQFQQTTNVSPNLLSQPFSNIPQNNVIVRTPSGKLVSVNLMSMNSSQQPSVSSNLVSPLIPIQTNQRASLYPSSGSTSQQAPTMHQSFHHQILQNQNQVNLQQQQVLNQLQNLQHFTGNTVQNTMQPQPFFFMPPNGVRFMVPSTNSLPSGTYVSPSSYPNIQSYHSLQGTWRPNIVREIQPNNLGYNFSPNLHPQSISTAQSLNKVYGTGLTNRFAFSNNNQNQNISQTVEQNFSQLNKNPISSMNETHSKKLRSLEASINFIKNGSQKRKSYPPNHLKGTNQDIAPPPVIILDSECTQVQTDKVENKLSSSVESFRDSLKNSPNIYDTKNDTVTLNRNDIKDKGLIELLKIYTEKRKEFSNQLQEEQRRVSDLTNELRARENEIKDTNILIDAKESELSFLRKRVEVAHEAVLNISSDRSKSIEQCNTITKHLVNLDLEIESARSESGDRV
ncbi:uncharacterized protein LOC101235376 isoform X1 [Hydra vulgaris]|uniref:uncharacterized protein LOC101235376 isoform X1 n=2 Tax=Hydra vulgaris TaxID=6087 RepID=UPI0006410BFB|nr:uncharacterized protein LOC101235376 isoform X1 [Hydra vulgaris]